MPERYDEIPGLNAEEAAGRLIRRPVL